MNYFRRLKDCREDRDLIQQQIADYLEVSRGTYAMYECGSNIIPLRLLDKLSIKYQVSVDYLVNLSTDKGNKKKIKPMNCTIMCERLKTKRLESKLSQEQVANILEITQSHYATYEKGRNIIPITRLIKLSKLYKTSTDYLMGKIDK